MQHPALKHIRHTLIAALGLTGCIEEPPSTAEPALDALLDAHPTDGVAPGPDMRGPDPRDARAPDPRDAAPPDAARDAAAPPPGCEGEPIPGADGAPSGYVQCRTGGVDRVGPAACAPVEPPGICPDNAGEDGQPTDCRVDADCTDGPFGRCGRPGFLADVACLCRYGCATDDDCQPDQVCVCDMVDGRAEVGVCRAAGCAEGADCETGRCGLALFDEGCGNITALACRTARDQCESNAGCGDLCEDGFCWPQCWPAGNRLGQRPEFSDRWHCDEPSSVCGRPLRVAARPRLAPSTVRGDWRGAPCPAVRLSMTDAVTLADHWTEVAALEHASVGSFARFSMQLLALGAPADLLADCQRAAADEVEHARLAYAIASAFAGDVIGPGPLSLDGLSLDVDPATVLREVIVEGCIGETLGALEAAEAARVTDDPAIAAACARIADDELRHAALGWRTARWLLACHPGLARMASEAFTDGMRHHTNGIDEAQSVIARHGIAPRPDLRRAAIAEVIAPLAARLLGEVGRMGDA